MGRRKKSAPEPVASVADDDAEAPATPAGEFTIGDRPVTLTVPRSLAERYDIVSCAGDDMTAQRVSGLALGLCWLRLRRRLARQGVSYRGNPAAFGGYVLNLLLEEGADIRSIVGAGHRAVNLCSEDLPGLAVPSSAKEVEKLVGNGGSTEEE